MMERKESLLIRQELPHKQREGGTSKGGKELPAWTVGGTNCLYKWIGKKRSHLHKLAVSGKESHLQIGGGKYFPTCTEDKVTSTYMRGNDNRSPAHPRTTRKDDSHIRTPRGNKLHMSRRQGMNVCATICTFNVCHVWGWHDDLYSGSFKLNFNSELVEVDFFFSYIITILNSMLHYL